MKLRLRLGLGLGLLGLGLVRLGFHDRLALSGCLVSSLCALKLLLEKFGICDTNTL